MTKKPKKGSREAHPDDFMVVSIGFDFQAKPNPTVRDVPPVDALTAEICLPAEEETAEFLEQIAKAIRERRLYGFVAQWCAEAPVGAGDWVGKTVQEIIAETKARESTTPAADNVTPLHKPSDRTPDKGA